LFFEKGAFFYAFFNLRLFFVLLFRKVDILVSNDLDTLLPNYLVSKLRSKKLVYDSHEYFTEVPELIDRPRVQKVWLKIERFIFPKLKDIITVNQSIANKYHQRYNKQLIVVRNVSPLWNDENIPSKSELGIPEDVKICIMQGAGLNKDRGVEEAIRAFEFLENTVLLVVGHGDVIPEMKTLVNKLNLTQKVLFFGKRPYKELLHFTFHADLGFSFDQPSNENYLFSLPNKIFDYMHTETPILCSDLVEVKALVNKYNIGQVISDFKPEALAKSIQQILNDTSLLENWKDNCRKAKQIECWENEVEKLAEIYPKNT
jgi:glycosyltransferase involved in cell wall biosynthesis